MKVQIKASSIELTPSIRDYAEKRVNSLQKYFHEEKEEAFASIEVGKTTHHHKGGFVYRAEISIRAHGKQYYAVAETEDLYAAIDKVRDEIAREVVSSKEKRETLFRRGGAKIKSIIKRLNWRKYE